MIKPSVAINGFGRMGRLGLRQAFVPQPRQGSTEGSNDAPYELMLINDAAGDVETAAHLLQFDSIHGRSEKFDLPAISVQTPPGETAQLKIGERTLSYTSTATIEAGDWEGIDIVLDCTGAYRTSASLAPYFAAGVKKVVVSAPVKDGPLNVVYGVNHDRFDPEVDHVVTAASCTTNCIAPMLSVLLNSFGVRRGAFTTIHALTNTQRVLDGFHKDLRRARSSATSLIPTTTGSATAIFEIFPELRGRLDGLAVRVPVAQASIADCTFELDRKVCVDEVHAAFAAAEGNELAGILGLEHRPLVSIDYEGDCRSAVIDAPSTQVIDGSLIKLLAWYDNETGYVARMMQLLSLVAENLVTENSGGR